MKVYLAGAINGQSWEGCNRWRQQATQALEAAGHEALSPLTGKESLSGKRVIAGAESWNYREIIQRDIRMVQEADVILAEYTSPDHKYIGTISEIAIAYHLGKPVVLWHGDNRPESWLKEMPVRAFEELGEALDYIIGYWGV